MIRSRANIAGLLGCIGFLAFYAVMARFAWINKSPTFDEPVDLLAAWEQVHDFDFRMDPEDLVFTKYWVAASTTTADLPADRDSPLWGRLLRRDTSGAFCYQTMFRSSSVDVQSLFAAARARMIVLAVVLGALISWWAWRLAGPLAGTVAAAAFSMDPNFLAHGPLVKNDVAMALVFLALMACVWLLGERATFWRWIGTSLLLGVALITKFSGLLALPMMGGAILIRAAAPQPWTIFNRVAATRSRRLLAALLMMAGSLLISYLVIWTSYGFRFAPDADDLPFNVGTFKFVVACTQEIITHHATFNTPPEIVAEWAKQWSPDTTTRTIDWLNDRRLLPQPWLVGLLATHGTTLIRPDFFCGEKGIYGWWYYFPMAMAFKTPLATIGAIFLGAISLGWWQENRASINTRRSWFVIMASLAILVPLLSFRYFHPGLRQYVPVYTCIILGLFVLSLGGVVVAIRSAVLSSLWPVIVASICPVIYMAVAIPSHINIGVRHVLPVYPFLFIFIGVAAARARKRWPRAATFIIAILGIGLAAECMSAYPNYIPFFNAAVGGARGGLNLLSDSNMDWGQELPDLAAWQARKSNKNRPLILRYFGFSDPNYYGIRFTPMQLDSVARARQLPPDSRPVFAISAVALQGSDAVYKHDNFYEAFKNAKPTEILGGSLYLFNTPDPVSDPGQEGHSP